MTAELVLGGAIVPGGKLALRPAETLLAGAAEALHCPAGEVQTLEIPLPAGLAGPVSIQLSSPGGAFDRARVEVLVADLGQRVQLVPHRWRTALAETEELTYHVLIQGPWPAGPAELVCKPLGVVEKQPARPIRLGTLELPAVPKGQTDARPVTLRAGDLPCGKYRIWLQAGRERSGAVPLEVVDWTAKSPFLLQAMSCCVTCWPLDEAGLDFLQSFDFQMGTATGHNSLLDTGMPHVSPALASRLHGSQPAFADELALTPAANDALLARLLRHRIRLIDLTTARGPIFTMRGFPTTTAMPRRSSG